MEDLRSFRYISGKLSEISEKKSIMVCLRACKVKYDSVEVLTIYDWFHGYFLSFQGIRLYWTNLISLLKIS